MTPIQQEQIWPENQKEIIAWVNHVAQTMNKLTIYVESLEKRIKELENPIVDIKL